MRKRINVLIATDLIVLSKAAKECGVVPRSIPVVYSEITCDIYVRRVKLAVASFDLDLHRVAVEDLEKEVPFPLTIELIDDDDLLILIAEEPRSAFHCRDGADVFSEVLVADVLGLARARRSDDDGNPGLEVARTLQERDGFLDAGVVLDIGLEVDVCDLAN